MGRPGRQERPVGGAVPHGMGPAAERELTRRLTLSKVSIQSLPAPKQMFVGLAVISFSPRVSRWLRWQALETNGCQVWLPTVAQVPGTLTPILTCRPTGTGGSLLTESRTHFLFRAGWEDKGELRNVSKQSIQDASSQRSTRKWGFSPNRMRESA